MHLIQFNAADLKNTPAMYIPHHSEVPVSERSHGMLVEYTELKRHYHLHLPDFNAPLVAEDSAEVVRITAEPGTINREQLVKFLKEHHIPFGAMNVIDPETINRVDL